MRGALGGRLSVSLVALLLGLLVVVQLRAQAVSPGLAALSTEDLTTLIANLNRDTAQLQTEVGELGGQLRDVKDTSTRGRSSLGELETDLRRVRLWSGQEAVRGRGAVLTFDGPVAADAVNDAVNELRSAGAEAIAIGGVRVVPGTVVAGEPGALSVQGVALAVPFDVRAVGNPTNLAAILIRPGGLIGRIQVAQPDVRVAVRESEMWLTLPQTQGPLVQPHASPRV